MLLSPSFVVRRAGLLDSNLVKNTLQDALLGKRADASFNPELERVLTAARRPTIYAIRELASTSSRVGARVLGCKLQGAVCRSCITMMGSSLTATWCCGMRQTPAGSSTEGCMRLIKTGREWQLHVALDVSRSVIGPCLWDGAEELGVILPERVLWKLGRDASKQDICANCFAVLHVFSLHFGPQRRSGGAHKEEG